MSKIKQYCGINMTEKIIKRLKRFESVHLKRCCKGRGLLEFIIRPDAWGADLRVRCIVCGIERHIDRGELY
jgi:hypothetical protein